jgi:hypothetical protein
VSYTPLLAAGLAHTQPDGTHRFPGHYLLAAPFSVGRPRALSRQHKGVAMLSVLIGVLIVCVVGAICFWAIDKFVREARLANLLKLLVVLICLASILQRVLPLAGINWM